MSPLAAPAPPVARLDGGTLTITVEGFAPPSLNTLLRAHWLVRRQHLARWTLFVRNAVQHLPREATSFGRATVTIRLYYRTQRRRDRDNATGGAAKLIGDALVAAGIVPDDSDQDIDLRPVELHVDKQRPRVEIVIAASSP